MRNIHKSTPPSFRRRENAAAIVKAPPPGALTKGPDRRFPGLHPPPGGATSPSLSPNRRFAFPILAFLAVLAVGLLFLLPGGLLQAQDDGTIEYAENGTDAVVTFSATDPDMDGIAWSQSGTDASAFTIDEDSGELKFVASPDYETPTDVGTTGAKDNVYEIIVTATDDGSLTDMKDVKVKVTDVEERATIELLTRQPVVGQPLTATLKNDDEVASGVRWTWEKKDGTSWVNAAGKIGTPTTAKPYSNIYTPVQSEINAELRVGVEYIDTDDDNQTVAAVAFEQPVVASVGGTNELPEFADGSAATRMIAEDASAGTAVGDPVTATDDHRTALTYAMVQTAPAPTDEAPASFKIDPKTGQISVSASAKLNYDPVGDTEAVRAYILTVSVADPDGATDSPATITVTVTVTDVAEVPKVTGPASKMVMEEMIAVGTYMGRDEAGDAIGLTLEGADAAAFGLTRSGNDYNLAFRTAPDFEKPADTGSNNEYQVTVAATDRGLKATRIVVVRVTNVNEDGEIKLTPEAPTVGMPVMAELSDDDVVQARTVTWLWSSKDDDTCNEQTAFGRGDRMADATSDTYTPMADDECLRVTARYTDGHGGNKNAMKTVEVEARQSNVPVFAEDDPIIRSVDENKEVDKDVGSVETPDTPSPVEATDADSGDTLTYTIVSVVPSSGAARFSIDNDGQLQTEEILDHEEQASYMLEVKATDSTGNSAMVSVTVNVNDVNDAPDAIVDSRRNNDNYPENGKAVVATFSVTDPDMDGIAWSRSGTDASAFTIDEDSGELKFAASPNYETPTDVGTTGAKDNVYEITVTATDDGTDPEETSKVVMVKVTDVEERATIELSTRQPVVEQPLTATLKNDDEVASGVRWNWSGIAGTQPNSGTYTPVTDDANARLSVGVKYIDNENKEQTVAAVAFEQPVAASLAGDETNDPPSFAEGNAATRMIAEDASAGTAVGDPVTATDDHRTALTYAMVQTAPAPTDEAPASFKIDPKTGQISVREGAELNYDVATARTYILMVTVDDPDGGVTGKATVTVTVTDVAEDPKVTGPASKMVMEETTAVGTYMGRDEAGDAIGLTLEGADAAAFGLTRSGNDYNLAFRTAPDFEKPADTGSNNEYQVTVAATDRGLKATRIVVVRVTNVNEDGEIKLTPEAPTVGMPVMAELSDDDVVQARTVTWLWSSKDDDTCNEQTAFGRGDRMADATSDTYTPMADDECLRVTARYTDGHGGNKNAMKTVEVEARESNVPVFTEDDPIIRSVDENKEVDKDVGSVETPDTPSPVEATDADSGDTLTYTIVSVVPSSGAARFSIDNDGQLQTKEILDHEEQASYMLEVKATDSTGNSARVSVTVNVNDVNEPPKIIVGGLVISGMSSIRYAEKGMGSVGTRYTAEGPNKDMAAWSLEGDDAGDFRISSDGTLRFGQSPDYENPMDADMDNVYMVTVKANDRTNNPMKAVTVVVTNVDERGRVTFWRDGADATTAAIMVGDELSGAVDDSDGNPGDTFPIAMYTRIANVTSWQWARSMDMTDWKDIGTASMYTVMDDDAGHYLRATATYTDGEGSDKEEIAETANMVTSNPMFPSETATRSVMENTDAGMNIGKPVTATDADMDIPTYTLGGADAASFDIHSMTGQLMTKAALDFETKSEYTLLTVTATDPSSGTAMISVTIMVTDMEEAGTVTLNSERPVVGERITATLDDPDTRVTGEVWQWARSMDLSIWDDIAGAKNDAYMPVEDDDDYYLQASVSYTDVHGLDKTAEKVSANAVEGGLAITGPHSPSYAENGKGAVGTYMAVGPGAARAAWSLSGEDASAFSFSNDGMLTFTSSPDYEDPMDTGMDNMYMVTISAYDGTYRETHDVMVVVTNVDEMVEVSGSTAVDYAENGTGPVATYTATDPENAAITWTLEGDDAADFEISSGGVLTFKSSPDHEAAADDDTDNAYEVTVVASAGTNVNRLDVTVTVTDVDETQPADFDPLAEYDADNSGKLEKDEVVQAINDYLFGEGADAISKDDVTETINLYLFG